MMKCVICKGYFNEPSYNHKPYGYSENGKRKYICKSCALMKVLKHEAWDVWDARMVNAASIPYAKFKRKESEE